jgi:hypothetical protein
MTALLVKDLPPELHGRLKEEAERNHRSMNRQVIAILEKELGGARPAGLPPPVKGRKSADPKWIVRIIREARDARP